MIGKKNLVPDALSRIKIDEEGNTVKCAMFTSKIIESREFIMEELRKDPEFKDIDAYLEDPEGFEQ